MTTTDTKTRPAFAPWFVVLTTGLIISNFVVFGVWSLLDPTLPFKELGEGGGAFPVRFFAIRHIVFALPLAYALVVRNTSILKAMYAMFLVMAVLDITVLLANDYFVPVIGELSTAATLAISLPGFIGTTSLGLWYLTRRI